ncbi:hypothetical protein AXG93_59s1230 [Marchantia polymorpha subsp. ruderalis]|uniref:Uncharacterized protein n=1 Tax=Marchantia polymorpha subsp. ruderalis TaxID=1480154 RepID=A0A176W2I9_MARPO|nr:hypothetical protein AXG93_59s1230 [Marchantia polymorpha subsp. ruderalis]
MAGSGAGGMIAGPGSKDNGGSAHCSAHGLLAYGAGSCVVVVDVRSMQLVVVLPMPSARTSPMLPAPFVTALQWIPECMSRDLTQEASTSHLRLAVGDRQGRVAIWDTAMKDIVIWLNLESEKGRLGIQDLCWVFGQPWLLAVIHGPSVLVIWDPQLARPIWKYDAGTEYLGSIRCDPFDARQVCVVGLKGLILSLLIQGVSDNDVSSKQHSVVVSEERNSGNLGGSSSGSTSAGAPALAAVPGAIAKAMFSPRTRGLLYLVFAREIIVFDLNFGMTLGTTPMGRGVGKILDVLAVADHDILYCAHQDGKISGWIKPENRQAFSMSFTETLIPPMGSPVPAPTVLAVIHCPLQVQVQNIEIEEESTPRLQLDSLPLPGSAPSPTGFIENLKDDLGGSQLASSVGSLVEATFVSITDDGRLWQWVVASTLKPGLDFSGDSPPAPKFKLELTMQLQLLPSAITTLAVPVPSLLGTVTGGSGAGAVAVPMVALATQGGTLELVDAAANAVTSSFAVHNSSVVRGVRWLGNTRLVSFSHTEVKGKGGGFVNKLVVTCVRSGQSKAFRELQKPERAPMRALRTSPSGRYLIVLFREAPAEVWLMSKVPSMLRSLALPFTVMEWALPPAPRSSAAHKVSVSARKPSLFYSTPPTIASTAASMNAVPAGAQPTGTGPTERSAGPAESESGESFAFALVNGSLGVFELRGKRVRDFRPKWPAASFVSSDVLVTAMAYRMPHVVMGDRMGNIRWWDVTSGLSSLFNTHRGGVRRIKFAPVTLGDPSRGRIAVLFNDHTFAVYDLDTQDPLANALVHPQLGGILVLELDWFPLRADKHEPLLLCIAGADGSFRLLEIYSTAKPAQGAIVRPSVWQRCRPMPLSSPALLPPPHAMAFRMLLQLGIKSSWFYVTPSTGVEIHLGTRGGDLRHFLLESSLPDIGETVAAEVLLKSLETYRRAGRLLDRERVAAYEAISSQGVAARAAFTAAHFGEYAEAVFWLQLPRALALLSIGSAGKNAFWKSANALPVRQQVQVAPSEEEEDEDSLQSILKPEVSRDSASNEQNQSSPEPSLSMIKLPFRSVDVVPCEQSAVTAAAQERITWHEKLTGPIATQKRVHEYVSVGDFESAVTLLLSTPLGDENFYLDALRAVSLASAVSPALHELAVKVVAANMVGRDDSLAGTHLLCAVGRYQEACSQLQDAGRWVDASTLAAAHLKGTDHARVLERWAEHVLADEHNLWRAMILYVAAGALSEALAALRNAQLPDSSALFLLACHEAKKYAMADRLKAQMEPQETPEQMDAAHSNVLDLPGDLNKHTDGVVAVCEYFGQYQRMLAHTVTSISPVID